jgi:F-type H+-transporting ATPase subunit epsilon
MATTQVELVTPNGMLFTGQAEMVVCRTAGGDIAFLANHMPYVGALEAYPLRIVHPEGAATGNAGLAGAAVGDELRFDVQGGFVEVNDNRVIILCDAAEPAGTEAGTN